MNKYYIIYIYTIHINIIINEFIIVWILYNNYIYIIYIYIILYNTKVCNDGVN